jgi:hypothetical protein
MIPPNNFGFFFISLSPAELFRLFLLLPPYPIFSNNFFLFIDEKIEERIKTPAREKRTAEIGLLKNMVRSPLEMSKDCRKDSSHVGHKI